MTLGGGDLLGFLLGGGDLVTLRLVEGDLVTPDFDEDRVEPEGGDLATLGLAEKTASYSSFDVLK